MLTNKVAVVTGAGGTLCSAMAINLAEQGYSVALLGRTLSKLKAVEEQIAAAGGKGMSIVADVSNEASVREACSRVEKDLGICNVLINGAGGNQNDALTSITEFDERELSGEGDVRGFFNPLTSITEFDERELSGEGDVRGFFNLDMETFKSVIDINTMGTVIPCFVFGKAMAKEKRGSILNFASMTSFRSLSKVAAYTIAKGGIVNFTHWLAAYLAPAGIRVNAIAPGFFLNDRSRTIMFNGDGSYTPRAISVLAHTPMKRFGEAPELIGCMNWLINDETAGFVTGQVIAVDGGFLSCAGV